MLWHEKSLGVVHFNCSHECVREWHMSMSKLEKGLRPSNPRGIHSVLHVPASWCMSLSSWKRNSSLCVPSPALHGPGTDEGHGAYHRAAPPCTTPSPRELCVIWGTCDTMWKRLLQFVRKDRRRPGTVLAWLTRFGGYVETTPNSKITWPVLR